MTYAFVFDASACTGCKACQVACKDRHNLPAGVLWRRVVEVSGGEWLSKDGAWINTVFAYNLALACNHCVHPKCAGVCPTNAYHVREDGIVLLDSLKCVGCGYCNWACPYAVPQYNQASGLMSKCNFCCESIDAGEPPACVAACPMRVLNFAEVSDPEIVPPARVRAEISLWEVPGCEHPFPLPVYSRTQPHIRLIPHPAMLNSLDKVVANREEIKPQIEKSEIPLVAFSLLIQMAVGVFWTSEWIFSIDRMVIPGSICLANRTGMVTPTLLVGSCLGLGMLIAFAHLGSKRNAWRMLSNLRKSWLSREILVLGLFSASWFLFSLYPALMVIPGTCTGSDLLGLITSFLGFGLIFSMANVYKLRSMAEWNNWRTLARFLLSALLLGQLALIPVLLVESQIVSISVFSAVLLIGELAMEGQVVGGRGVQVVGRAASWLFRLRAGLIVLIVVGLLGVSCVPALAQVANRVFLLLLLIVEEVIGRWLFYAGLGRRVL